MLDAPPPPVPLGLVVMEVEVVAITAVYENVELVVGAGAMVSCCWTIAMTVYLPLTFQSGPPACKVVLKLSFWLTAAGTATMASRAGLSMVTVTAVAPEGATPVTTIIAPPV